jgi:hypothetical protein
LTKKKLLVLAYEYYPTENANTRIIRHTCERLADRYETDLVTVRTPGDTGPEESGKFRVIRVPGYSFHREKCTGPVTPFVFARMAAEKIRGKITHDETRMLERLYEREIRKAVSAGSYDAIVSFSAPFLPHGCASRISAETGVPWTAVCLDPYFSHRIFGPEGLERRKKREEAVMANAAAVLMTYPTDRDYLRAGVSFRDRIRGIEMPGIAPCVQEPAEAGPNPGPVRCCFFGSMYREIRDPRPAIALFSAAGEGIEARFAGRIVDGTKEEVFAEGCPCRYLGELAGETLAGEYADAEVLVNIGNSVDNQMPSKIFEYISTGKPIINIFKSADCPTLKYLGRYPLVLNIHEAEIRKDPAACVSRVQAFCRGHRGERVPAEETKRLYAANTFEAFTESICRAIEGEEDKA